MNVSEGMKQFAQAIGVAEGFGVAGAVPTRANNPGDLKLGDVGHGVTGAEGITIFADESEGWDRLYRQLSLIRDRKSANYTPDFTIAQMAAKWTGTQKGEWAANVAKYLRSTPDAKISTWIGDIRS